MWLGDVAYVDNPNNFGPMPTDYIRERLDMTKNAEGYSSLLQKSAIIGVWDDHDFGTNDGGRRFEFKDQNRDIWLDFIDEPSDTERRTQRGTPIHQDYFVTKGDLTVQIILLDNRYENDDDSIWYGSGDVLGED